MMPTKRFFATAPALLALAVWAGDARGQTVQLPSFRTFSYSGSVLVPDRGATSLGGISRSSSYQTRRGLSGRSFGSSIGHAGGTAHVTIIDNDAIDRHLRGLPPKGAAGQPRPAGRAARANPPATNVRRDAIEDPDAEGKALVRFARKQYRAGKKSSSYEAYQLAIQTLSPELAELARAECRRVFPRTGLAQLPPTVR